MLLVKKIKPLFTALITTMEKYDTDLIMAGGLIDTSKQKGALKEYQTVLALGATVREIEVGDLVSINPKRFAVMKHKEGSMQDGVTKDNPVVEYNFDIVRVDGKDCLLLQDRDIEFIIEEYEEVDDLPQMKIIQPPKPSIIL